MEEVSSYIDNEIYAIKMDNIIKIVTGIIALVVLVICFLFTDNNPNQLPTLVAIIAVIYILYAFLSVIFNKNRLKKLQEWKSELEQRK